jgi:hypothetical protein
MPWLSQPETAAELKKLPFDIGPFWAASKFLASAFYDKDFTAAEEWEEIVQLTDEGKIAKQILLKAAPEFPKGTIAFFLFRDFYRRSFFIDCEQMKVADVLGLVRTIDSKKQAVWPYVFGKELYDKFNETYDGNRTENLEADDVKALLDGTPHGIFQVGTLISGPLGFLDSAEKRSVPPVLQMPLWHCSDTGCGALHLVEARQHNSAFHLSSRDFARRLSDHFGHPSEWEDQLDRAAAGGESQRSKPFIDMLTLLCDCVMRPELTKLCIRALRTIQGAKAKREAEKLRRLPNSPEDTVKALTFWEQQQLLLLLPNADLVVLIDELIAGRAIDIPASEIRAPKTYSPRRPSYFKSEISSLGVRSTRHGPLLRLHAEVWQAYKDLGLLSDLSWRIRRTQSDESGLAIALMDYLRVNGAESVVKNLILPSAAVTSEIQKRLYFRLDAQLPEVDSVRSILWKFGFSVARHSKDLSLLRGRITEFKAAVLKMPLLPNEEDCAVVRSAGVNLFVSLEGFLEDLLAFNVWLLASDHFAGTHFKYSKMDAVKSVAKVLGERITSGAVIFTWNNEGQNTLGSLLGYLEAMRKWIASLPIASREELKRAKQDFPHYAKDPVISFPFTHVEFWADASVDKLSEYSSLIDTILTQAAQADFAAVRNGIDHKREEGAFPTTDKMLGCTSRLEQVIDIADHRSLIPKLIWPSKAELDSEGNSTLYLEDYKGTISTIFGPTPVVGGAEHSFGIPYVAFPLNFLALPNSEMLLYVTPKSDYSKYWTDYPLRRFIPPRRPDGEDVSDSEADEPHSK